MPRESGPRAASIADPLAGRRPPREIAASGTESQRAKVITEETPAAFYEEDDRILGHAADPYHRIDIRRTSRHLRVRAGDRVIADTASPLVLYESGFAPRWYVPVPTSSPRP